MKKIAIFLAMFAIVVSVVVSNSAFALSTQISDAVDSFAVSTDVYVASDKNSEAADAGDTDDVELIGETEPTKPVDKNVDSLSTNATLQTVAVETETTETPANTSKKSTHRNSPLEANTSNASSETTEEVVPADVAMRLDFNDDGRTGNLDIQLTQSHWGACPEKTDEEFCMGDADLNGVVNFADITMLLAHWSPRMRSDLNWDDVVDHTDLKMLMLKWESCPSEEDEECRADINQDNEVSFADVTMLLADWTDTTERGALYRNN